MVLENIDWSNSPVCRHLCAELMLSITVMLVC
jgi:hypothetical protein